MDSLSVRHNIFQNIEQDPHTTDSQKKTLQSLKINSKSLFTHLNQEEIDKSEVNIKICQIASEWRTLMASYRDEPRSDENRLKAFHVFQNILDEVRVIVTTKKGKEVEKQVALIQEQEAGWVGWATTGVVNAAALTAGFVAGALSESANLIVPKSYEEWALEKKDEFLEYTSKILQGNGNEAVTFDDILKGIEEWQAFINLEDEKLKYKAPDIRQNDDSKNKSEETESGRCVRNGDLLTDLRIEHLKKTVAEKLKENSQSELTTEEKNEMKAFLDEVDKKHSEDLEKAVHEAEKYKIPAEVERGINERALKTFKKAYDQGEGAAAALTKAINQSVVESVSYLADQGLLLNQQLDSTKDRLQSALDFIDQQIATTTKNLSQKMNELVRATGDEIKAKLDSLNPDKLKTDYIVEPYSPKSLLGEEATLSQFLKNSVWCWVPSIESLATEAKTTEDTKNQNISPKNDPFGFKRIVLDLLNYSPKKLIDSSMTPLYRSIDQQINKLEEHITQNVQDNVSKILEPPNITKLGVVAVKSLKNLCQSLHQGTMKSPENVLAELLKKKALSKILH